MTPPATPESIPEIVLDNILENILENDLFLVAAERAAREELEDEKWVESELLKGLGTS